MSVWTWFCKLSRRTQAFLVFVITVGPMLLALLVSPAPYVRVSNATLMLMLPSIPEHLIVVPRTSYLKLRRAELVVQDVRGQIPASRIPFQSSAGAATSTGDFPLFLTQTDQDSIRSMLNDLGRDQTKFELFAVVEFERVPFFDIEKVEIKTSTQTTKGTVNAVTLSGDGLEKAISKGTPQVRRIRMPQEEISDAVRKVNDIIGNTIVAVLCIALLWLLGTMTKAIIECALLQSEELLKKSASAHTNESIKNAFRITERGLIFARVVGPAIGFALTVSSLIAGLHPSQQGTQNSYLLISSLQLALVATFMGLFIRITAEISLRAHRYAAERKLRWLQEEVSQ